MKVEISIRYETVQFGPSVNLRFNDKKNILWLVIRQDGVGVLFQETDRSKLLNLGDIPFEPSSVRNIGVDWSGNNVVFAVDGHFYSYNNDLELHGDQIR